MNKTGKTLRQLVKQDEDNARKLGLIPEGSIFTKQAFESTIKYSKENRRLLESCDTHNFSIYLEGDNPKLSSSHRWECSKCGGEVDEAAKTWYELGLLHGQKLKEG